jgi:hypothetical protein
MCEVVSHVRLLFLHALVPYVLVLCSHDAGLWLLVIVILFVHSREPTGLLSKHIDNKIDTPCDYLFSIAYAWEQSRDKKTTNNQHIIRLIHLVITCCFLCTEYNEH